MNKSFFYPELNRRIGRGGGEGGGSFSISAREPSHNVRFQEEELASMVRANEWPFDTTNRNNGRDPSTQWMAVQEVTRQPASTLEPISTTLPPFGSLLDSRNPGRQLLEDNNNSIEIDISKVYIQNQCEICGDQCLVQMAQPWQGVCHNFKCVDCSTKQLNGGWTGPSFTVTQEYNGGQSYLQRNQDVPMGPNAWNIGTSINSGTDGLIGPVNSFPTSNSVSFIPHNPPSNSEPNATMWRYQFGTEDSSPASNSISTYHHSPSAPEASMFNRNLLLTSRAQEMLAPQEINPSITTSINQEIFTQGAEVQMRNTNVTTKKKLQESIEAPRLRLHNSTETYIPNNHLRKDALNPDIDVNFKNENSKGSFNLPIKKRHYRSSEGLENCTTEEASPEVIQIKEETAEPDEGYETNYISSVNTGMNELEASGFPEGTCTLDNNASTVNELGNLGLIGLNMSCNTTTTATTTSIQQAYLKRTSSIGVEDFRTQDRFHVETTSVSGSVMAQPLEFIIAPEPIPPVYISQDSVEQNAYVAQDQTGNVNPIANQVIIEESTLHNQETTGFPRGEENGDGFEGVSQSQQLVQQSVLVPIPAIPLIQVKTEVKTENIEESNVDNTEASIPRKQPRDAASPDLCIGVIEDTKSSQGKSNITLRSKTKTISDRIPLTSIKNFRQLKKHRSSKSSKNSGTAKLPNGAKEKESQGTDFSHIIEQPGDPVMYHCTLCDRKFKTRANKKYHTHEPGAEHFKCEHCGKKFISKNHYEYHDKTHTGERPHVCKACGKGFIQKNKLKRHHMSHTGEKPLKCFCGKGFANRSALRAHLLTHIKDKRIVSDSGNGVKTRTSLPRNEKPNSGNGRPSPYVKTFNAMDSLRHHGKTHKDTKYPCDVPTCDKTFTTRKDMLRHKVTHGEPLLHECWICGRKFNRKDNLTRHIKSIHSVSQKAAKLLADEAAEKAKQTKEHK